MNPTEFSQRLAQAEPGSPEAAALARDLVEDARYPASFVLQQYFSSSKIPEQMKAKSVLADARELSLVPMAGTASMPHLETELWMIRTMAAELVALRRRTASLLKRLLANRSPAPPTREGPSSYQTPRSPRVCDLAFILLHRILHLESSPSVFLSLLPDARDKRIKEFQQLRAFRSLNPS